MIVIVFRSRVRAGLEEADFAILGALGARMYALATAMPGFLSYKDFTAGDGESVSIVEFESAEALLAWREHPEHKEAQRLARERYLAEYRIQVCSPMRSYRFDHGQLP
jgi:heme-degrading monooxygenase HmoA